MRRFELVCACVILAAIAAASYAVLTRDRIERQTARPAFSDAELSPSRGSYAPSELRYRQLEPLRRAVRRAQAAWESFKLNPLHRDADIPASNLVGALTAGVRAGQNLPWSTHHIYRGGSVILCTLLGQPPDRWGCLAARLPRSQDRLFAVTFREAGGRARAYQLAKTRAERWLPTAEPAD